MVKPSCLMRPRPAPFANFGLPILHAGEGLGSKLAPPSVAGTKGTLHSRPFPLISLLWKKPTSPWTFGPLWRGSSALLSPIQPHAPYFRRSARVLYPEGPELVQGGCGPHFWPLQVDRMPLHAPPSAKALKGPEPLILQGVQGSAYPPPQGRLWRGFEGAGFANPPPPQ